MIEKKEVCVWSGKVVSHRTEMSLFQCFTVPPPSFNDILGESEDGDTLHLQDESSSYFSVHEGPQRISLNELIDLVTDLGLSIDDKIEAKKRKLNITWDLIFVI
ncbi:hypothetical protein NPIL_3211 [Nephila pilipes]|uniref:Uncharacterized protein n=1 Tax=Nephila pilipes TaxID=299642 RepID=A0A8X6J8Q9_NEPPI|nr:hypothetical protein NPIL_3211 [Nephila pilipes]